jgi:ferritin-like protein
MKGVAGPAVAHGRRAASKVTRTGEGAAMSSGIHEAGLSSGALDLHRALASLQEELEAVDWYNQRMDVTQDATLKAVLAHNRDEELEHAVMTLEWLRRGMPVLDAQLRRLLFQPGDIAARAGAEEATDRAGPGAARDLGLGNLQSGKAGGDGHDGHAQAGMGAHRR